MHPCTLRHNTYYSEAITTGNPVVWSACILHALVFNFLLFFSVFYLFIWRNNYQRNKMALTRSARIRGAIEKEPAVIAPVKPAAKPIKRKAPAKRETQNKKQATTLNHIKNEDVPQPQSSLGNKALSLFPAEVLNMILDNVSEYQSNVSLIAAPLRQPGQRPQDYEQTESSLQRVLHNYGTTFT